MGIRGAAPKYLWNKTHFEVEEIDILGYNFQTFVSYVIK